MVRTYEEALLHHSVRTRESLQVSAVGWMSGDVAGKENPNLHVVTLEEVQHSLPVVIEKRQRQPVELLVPGWKSIAGARSGKVLHVPVHVAAPDLLEPVELAELRKAECRAHLAGLHVVAHSAVEELEVILDAVDGVPKALVHVLGVVANPAPVAEHQGLISELWVVEHDHAAEAPRRDYVGGVEGDDADVRFGGVGHGVARVLKEPNVLRHLGSQLRPLHLAACEVRHQYASGLRGDGRKNHVHGRNVAGRIYVTEDRGEAELYYWRNRSSKRTRGSHYLVPLLQAQDCQTDQVPRTARVHHHA
mmetsp:Transcript_89092/g.236693  ORF Transcript_89092/g.236693 Transcript_89092/m.236693 type:complete len:305 (+) Transcript_89092:229-1143(+)